VACKVCKHSWEAKLGNLLYNKSGCFKCGVSRRCSLSSSNAHNRYLTLLRTKFSDSVKMIGPWKGATVATKHRCSKGHVFLKSPNHVAVSKKGSCSQCAYETNGKRSRRVETAATVRRLLEKKHGPKYTVLSYSGEYLRPACIRCNDCGTHLNVPAQRLVDAPKDHGCLVCSPKFLSAHWFGTKPYRLGRKTIEVQGYEPLALDLIRQHVHYKDIVAGKGSDMPVVPYFFENKMRTYLPDIFIPKKNLLIEVKSTRTFGLWDKTLIRKNMAKAKACVDLGYRFRLAIIHGQRRIPVPNDWFTLTPRKLTSIIRFEQRKMSCKVST
jgi:hypothetical protein